MMGFEMGFGWIFPVIFVALGLWLVYQIVQRNNFMNPENRDKTPLEILKERYARGEISKTEFERMRDDLQ